SFQDSRLITEYAACNGNPILLSLLRDMGCDFGLNVYMRALSNKKLDNLKFLTEHPGLYCDSQITKEGLSSLFWEGVEVLIKNGFYCTQDATDIIIQKAPLKIIE